jgi:hypothetical protein
MNLTWREPNYSSDSFVAAQVQSDGRVYLSCGLDEYEMWGEVMLTPEQAVLVANALLGVDNM